MKYFVENLDRNSDSWKYLKKMYQKLSSEKSTFVVP